MDQLTEFVFNDSFVGLGKCDDDLRWLLCSYDNGDCCSESAIGNEYCENYQNFAACGNFDGGF